MEGLTAGRMVHYVLSSKYRSMGEHRPAIVIRTWGNPPSEPFPIQLAVMIDGSNDLAGDFLADPDVVKWETSVPYDETGQRPGSWHWIERA